MTNKKSGGRVPAPRDDGPAEVSPAMQEWAELLMARARAEGVSITGEGGLLTAMVRQVLQTGLEVEMTEHLGYDRHNPAGRGSGNNTATAPTRNGVERDRRRRRVHAPRPPRQL